MTSSSNNPTNIVTARQNAHRAYYEQLTSMAVAASHRLMLKANDVVLIQKTTDAAVNGYRPEFLERLEKVDAYSRRQFKPDIVPEDVYAGRIVEDKQDLEPIVDICLISTETPCPPEYSYVTNSKNEHLPILLGSGEGYHLCYRRRNSAHNGQDRPITDIQIVFRKSNIPQGYVPLNRTYDGNILSYLAPNNLSQPLPPSTSVTDVDPNSDNLNGRVPNSTPSLKLNQSTTDEALNSTRNANENPTEEHPDTLINKSKSMATLPSMMNNNDNSSAPEVKKSLSTDEKTLQDYPNLTLEPAHDQDQENDMYSAVPMIIFTYSGDAPIVNLELMYVLKNRPGFISISNSLEKKSANLNAGTKDDTRNLFLSIALDVRAYRFSQQELAEQVNWKYLTPLLVTLHIRKPDLAITALESLKYLLLSNFIRFKDRSIMSLGLIRICRAVSQSIVTFDNDYHAQLMECLCIILEKFIHYLHPSSMWNILSSALLPLDVDLCTRLFECFLNTSIAYMRVLVFGDEMDERGLLVIKQNQLLNALKESSAAPHIARLFSATETMEEERDLNIDAEDAIRALIRDIADMASRKAEAEMMIEEIFKRNILSPESRNIVGRMGDALFSTGIDKAWGPFAILFLFCTRQCLIPSDVPFSNAFRNRSFRLSLKFLQMMLEQLKNPIFRKRMPETFKFLVRRSLSRMIIYNLCSATDEHSDGNVDSRFADPDKMTPFLTTLNIFQTMCINCWSFFQQEIGVIIEQVLLPQLMEQFTPLERKFQILTLIKEICALPEFVIELTYSIDIMGGKRVMHSLLDCLLGLLVETCIHLKQLGTPVIELVNLDPNSFQKNYDFQLLVLRCAANMTKSFSQWFVKHAILQNGEERIAMEENMMQSWNKGKANANSKNTPVVTFSATETRWQQWLYYRKIEREAMDLISSLNEEDSEKAVGKAVALLQSHDLLAPNGACIADWLHKHRWDIPPTMLGDYLGGTRPKDDKPFEEDIRQYYIRKCNLNFDKGLEYVMGQFLTECGFRMPKESQKIERILESFAEVFLSKRPNDFGTADAAFVVFNAILILNTSLHNPQMKKKDRLKVEQFVNMCINVPNQHLSSHDYEKVYEHIKNFPYQISFDHEDKEANERKIDKWCRRSVRMERYPMFAQTTRILRKLRDLPSYNLNLVSSADSARRSAVSDAPSPHAHPTDLLESDDEDILDDPFSDEKTKEKKEAIVARDRALSSEAKTAQEELVGTLKDQKKEKDQKKKMVQYFHFLDQTATRASFSLAHVASNSTQNIPVEKPFEVACVLMDNWWGRFLDIIKTMCDAAIDPRSTPMALEMFEHIFQLSVYLRMYGHESAAVAFDAFLQRYLKWWTIARKKLTQNVADTLPLKEAFDKIRKTIWKDPEVQLVELQGLMNACQAAVITKAQSERMQGVAFHFENTLINVNRREFLGSQDVVKVSNDERSRTDYRMFLFSDMVLYASGKPGKYKVHRILYLAFCTLDNLPDCRNYQNAFRINSPQKSITIALLSPYIKRVCYEKIDQAIKDHRGAVARLIMEIRAEKNADLDKVADLFCRSSAFLLKDLESIKKKRMLYNDHCKLCCKPFQTVIKRRKTCPVCNDGNVCRDCFNEKADLLDGSKKKVCDGCVDIVNGKIRVEDWYPLLPQDEI